MDVCVHVCTCAYNYCVYIIIIDLYLYVCGVCMYLIV